MMNKSYLLWAFIGMVGYSFVALLVKLATASMVVISSAAITFLPRRDESVLVEQSATTDGAFLLGTGVALAVAVVSYFLALSIRPASIVVPVFGMFIVGGAVLGLMFLHEPLTLRKCIGILLAIASIYLIAGHQKP